jgi:hypothetical protein
MFDQERDSLLLNVISFAGTGGNPLYPQNSADSETQVFTVYTSMGRIVLWRLTSEILVAFTITETDKGEYHHIIVSGSLEASDASELHKEMFEFVKRYPKGKFLLDITALKGRPGVLRTIQTVQSFPREMIESIKDVAVLDNIRNRISGIVEETIMVNRGLNVKFFSNEAKAIRWLME